MIQPGIEPWSLGPLANTLLINRDFWIVFQLPTTTTGSSVALSGIHAG